MIFCGAALCVLSGLFFVLWQYWESPWLIFVHILAVLTVCAVYFITEKRKNRRILSRFERIFREGGADTLADESLTPTERKLIARLCELEAREQRVQNGYRSISSLVSDIAHQSKTPLSAILMYTELEEGVHTGILRSQTEKLKFLMESLTRLAKCEGGLIAENLTPRENPVKELLRSVIETNYAAADEKNMEIRCAVPDDLQAVFDMRWTAEAVGNILDNAIKYAPAGSEIRLSACAYDMFVRIDITDRGCGIPEEELCHIWKRFYRGKNAEGESGVGIGLYLTACILNAEGGRVCVKSAGQGSTFSVFLSRL
ncbi:MAG: HAMP domain-containing histidine kinase [Clostridia bacterium]|nr:HAMP domain-containing histidine kinase [Clostridia bacterium]